MKLFLRRSLFLFGIVAGGTVIDFITHHLREAWHVEPEYFVGKILFGTFWAIAGFYILRQVLGVRTWRGMMWGVPAIVAGVLQTKYFYQGRPLDFVITFLFLHYLMFIPFSWFVFKRHQGLFGLDGASGRLHWAKFIAVSIAVEILFAAYFLWLYGWTR